MSSPHTSTWVYLEDAEADVQVTLSSVPGLVAIRFGDVVVHVVGDDVDRRTERLLNRLRMDLNAQIAQREHEP